MVALRTRGGEGAAGHDLRLCRLLPVCAGGGGAFADDLAASRMARLGVFVRAGSLWARLLRVHKVVFDKTGTLTMENPVLANPVEVRGMPPGARAALRKIVSSNLHPVSRSLFDALGPDAAFDDAAAAGGIEEIAGQGLRWTSPDGRVWALGRPGWGDVKMAMEGGVGVPREARAADAWFTCDGVLQAGFRFTDSLRPESVEACEALRGRGCKLYLLSGDREAKVAAVAGQLHIPVTHWQAEMTPEGKAARVRQMNQQDTLYLGDGANDVLALEAALCAGSPVTGRNFLEHRADFYFLGNCLRFMPELLQMAVVRSRAVRRVLAFALAYNAAAVALSLAGWMNRCWQRCSCR
nr:HAD family hydrolase [Verrucomicrobium spinosum]